MEWIFVFFIKKGTGAKPLLSHQKSCVPNTKKQPVDISLQCLPEKIHQILIEKTKARLIRIRLSTMILITTINFPGV
jgi:hypothetical protein